MLSISHSLYITYVTKWKLTLLDMHRAHMYAHRVEVWIGNQISRENCVYVHSCNEIVNKEVRTVKLVLLICNHANTFSFIAQWVHKFFNDIIIKVCRVWVTFHERPLNKKYCLSCTQFFTLLMKVHTKTTWYTKNSIFNSRN